MTLYLSAIAVVLLGTLVLGLVRVRRGPTAGDRMASVLLAGTTGVAVMLILATIEGDGATLDTALVLAVLAPVLGVAFVAARRRPEPGEADDG
ncbi:MAG: monovalent cation/H+ antiporter complex subunit F [Halieaceae bacterium]|jgi:multicomponent Na+:H+ antiporter subunit F|nr:monovalent cation/H+ antiporter complex subunit F [Halieaceae bacterium]